jgi:hypothetical protein
LLWIVAIIGVAACQPITVKEVDCPLTTTVRMDDAAYWLEEWQRAIALPEDRLVQTLNTRELEFERSANPRTRLRLALLLAEGPQPVRDQARALELLSDFDASQASDSEKALAALLTQVIKEQRWFSDKIAELNRKSKDSQTHVEELERQLRELTTIEQNIQQRELPNSRKEK